jgi:hypothetical protein
MDRSHLIVMVIAIGACSSKGPSPDLLRRDTAVDLRRADLVGSEARVDARRDAHAAVDQAPDLRRDAALPDLAIDRDSLVPGDKLQDLCAWTIDASGAWRTFCERSTGNGAFLTAIDTVQSATSFAGYAVVVADVNGDGKQDLCAWGIDNGVWRTYCALAVGNGTFQTAVHTAQSATSFAGYSVLVADVNGDGKQDLCAWGIDSGGWHTYCALATGSGVFQTAVKTTQGSTTFDGFSVVVADVNGDGKKDLCAWAIDSGTWETYCALASSGGAFQVAVHTAQSSTSFAGYAMIDPVGDVNGDGKQDLCVWAIDNGYWRTHCALATGTGGFQAAVQTVQSATSFAGYSVVPVDVNGDGSQDLCAWAVVNGAWWSYCALAAGGTFQPAVKTAQTATSFTGFLVIPVDAG